MGLVGGGDAAIHRDQEEDVLNLLGCAAVGDSGTLNDFGIQATLNGICKPHDFNGTLTGSASDILWQSNDGTAGIWLMDGFTATSVGAAGPNGPWPFNPGSSWHVKGDADFDFDGRSDILWQNNDGTPAMWRMNGLAAVTLGAVGTNPGPDWHIKGTGDFNFDGPADILWQNDNGMPAIWLMNGFNVLTNGPAGAFNLLGCAAVGERPLDVDAQLVGAPGARHHRDHCERFRRQRQRRPAPHVAVGVGVDDVLQRLAERAECFHALVDGVVAEHLSAKLQALFV